MTHRTHKHMSTPFARLSACSQPFAGLPGAGAGRGKGGRRWVPRLALASVLCMSALAGAVSTALPAALAASNPDCPTTESALQSGISAVASDGTFTFNCGSATTISFTSSMHIGQNVTLDASGSAPVIFDGGGSTQILFVELGITFGLKGLTLQNGSSSYAGAIDNNGTLNIADSTFSGNSATGSNGSGGAIFNAATMTVINSTFTGNSATGSNNRGGAIDNEAGDAASVTYSTFSGNSATSGGAIYNDAGDLTLSADIFTNSPTGGNCTNNHGYVADSGYNVDTDSSCTSAKTGDTTADPKLGPLANNGGPTQTFALFPGSPAIDLVPAAQCPSTDQRGAPRNANGETSCDAGAFEYLENTLTCPSSTSIANAVAAAPSAWEETIELTCSAPLTISFSGTGNSQTITVNKNLILDGSHSPGTITLDGGYNGNPSSMSGVQLFSVNAGIAFELEGLTLKDGDQSFGGAIYNGGTLTVANSTFSNNEAFGAGGGAIANEGTLTVTNGTFSGNGTGAEGGVIYNAQGHTATVTDSTFSGNSAGSGGAIYDDVGTTATVNKSTFSGNSAGSAGAIDNYQGSLTVTNSTFSGNSAVGTNSVDGAIYNGPGVSASVTFSTFSANSADSGGAIGDDGTLTVGADIFAHGPPGGNCDINRSSGATLIDNGYNVDTDGSCTSGKMGDTSADSRLGSLTDNGGPTQTIALLPGSPATDAVPAGECPSTDQRGAPRPDNGESFCDIGAFEFVENNLGCPTSAALANAIANAPSAYTETIELSCATPTTIDFSGTGNSGTITVAKSLTLYAGGSPGAITLDGGYNGNPSSPTGVELFQVNGGVTFEVDDLTLQNGYSAIGGAINNDGTLTVDDTSFTGNASPQGGAINNNGTLAVTNSTLSGNSATTGGIGGAINSSGTLTVSNSTLSGNSATGDGGSGGAIGSYGSGLVTVTNSTFSGNSAPGSGGTGGAIGNGGPLTVTNSTFSGNSASNGGAIFSNWNVTLGADILANSPSGGNCSINGGGVVADNGYNIDTDSTCVSGTTGDTSADPKLGSLANYGGRTQTLALLAGSPAIGAIPASSGLCPASGLDQRGYFRRPSTCDIGAFETGARPDYGDVAGATSPGLTNLFAGTPGTGSNYGNAVSVSAAAAGFPLTIEGHYMGSGGGFGTVNITYSDGTSTTVNYSGSDGSTATINVPADAGAMAGVDDISFTRSSLPTSNVLPLYVTPAPSTVSAFTAAAVPNTASVNGTGAGTPWSISAKDSGSSDSGILDVAQYTVDPSGAAVGVPGGKDYFDVHLSSGTAIQVTITDCTPGDNSIYWYNPTLNAWQLPTNLTNESTVNGCVQLVVDNSAADRPNVGDLQDAIFAGSNNSPTYAPVTHFRVVHRGGQLVFTWRLANRSRVVGFNLYAGAHRLNRRLIPLHSSPLYAVRAPWTRAKGSYQLQVVLGNARSVRIA